MTTIINSLLKQLETTSQMSEMLKLNQEIEKLNYFSQTITWGVSANITIDQLEIPLKKYGFLNHKFAKTVMGSYDSHLENIELFKRQGVEYAFFLNFFDALMPSLEARAATITNELSGELRSKLQNQLSIILKSAPEFRAMFIPKFHRFSPHSSIGSHDPLDTMIEEMNTMMKSFTQNFTNVHLIDLNSIVSTVGRNDSFNTRFYYKFKAPYSIMFLEELSRHLYIQTRGAGAYFYKALILDCDNTLWGGIVGEDSINGIKLSPHEYPDNIYWTIQNEIVALKNSGALIVLCSKNNAADVDEVLMKHDHSVLRDEHVILKKVNWQDKPENIKQIAKELNIGLDSLIFLDDSDFECNAVRAQLPQVKTIQVPKNVFEYPKVFQKVKELFSSIEQKEDSSDKTEQYRIRAQAIQEEAKFSNEEEYLASLGLKVKLRKNHLPSVARISELTQKSNQFNVTTRRYTPQNITNFMSAKGTAVYSLEVSDKFGDSGLTGVAIVAYDNNELLIDSFLMSCRVIGRGVEFSVWDQIFKDALAKDCSIAKAEYIKSPKNILVENFFDKLGFNITHESEGNKRYNSTLSSFTNLKKSHIEVNYES